MEMMALNVVCEWREAISSTTNPNGWIEHSRGAGRLVLTKPLEGDTASFAHAIFRIVRYIVVRLSESDCSFPSVTNLPE